MRKKEKNNNLIISIIIVLMFIIFIGTVYFCLDVFGVITVPTQYSIASLFYSQIETIATSGQILTEEDISLNENKTIERNIVKDSANNEIADISNRTSIHLNELNNAQNNERNQDNQNQPEEVINQNVNVERFYYDQLDEYGKIIYDKLYENLEKLKTGTYTAEFDTTFDELLHQENGSDILNNSFQLAINALTFDNPELFYIDITKINLITEITTKAFSTTYRISIGGNGNSYLSDHFYSLENVVNEIQNIENIKYDIISRTTNNQVENLKIVHDYLVENIEYDVDAGKNVYNVYGALVNKKAVCEGYARAYKLILDDLGIPCIIACGVAENSSGDIESHAWNYVQIDGNWYAVDVTWDDPIIIGNGSATDEIKYRYFLVGSEQFFTDHFEDGNIAVEYNFKYPELNKEDY